MLCGHAGRLCPGKGAQHAGQMMTTGTFCFVTAVTWSSTTTALCRPFQTSPLVRLKGSYHTNHDNWYIPISQQLAGVCVPADSCSVFAGEWFCPACVRAARADSAGQCGAESTQQPVLALQHSAAQPALAPHPAVQRNEFQRAAELLGTVEYADLSPVRLIRPPFD